MPKPPLSMRCPAHWWLLALSQFVIGCGDRDEIRSYVVPPLAGGGTDAPAIELPPEDLGEPTHRMLGAIIPGGRQAWFFKVTAPMAVATGIEPTVSKLFDSITLAEDDGRPTWELPDGWVDRGASGMRLATLVIPAGDSTGGSPVELSVIGLPSSANWSRLVLDNANRWRGQMKLDPLSEKDLSSATRKLESAPEGAVALDFAGWFEAGGMTPRFASKPPPTVPDANNPIVKPAASRKSLTYETPAGWIDEEPRPPRLASLKTSDSGDAALVKAFAFPAAGAMGDTLANVNRWRGQLGLETTTVDALEQQAMDISIDEVPGKLIEIEGADAAILAAMATRGDKVWFFKLDGPAGAGQQHRDAFVDWLKSVRFKKTEAPSE